MSITSTQARLQFVAALIALSSLSADAQSFNEGTNTAVRQKCAAYAADLQRNLVDRDALAGAARCDRTGPDLLAKSWGAAPSRQDDFNALLSSSRSISDKRLVKQLSALAADRTLSVNRRAGALATLASYLDPKFGGMLVASKTDPSGYRVSLGRFDHSSAISGTEPLSASDIQAIKTLAASLAKSDTALAIRGMAQEIVQIKTSN